MSDPESAARLAPQASISVIVPAWNSGRFIAEALDSILAQTLQPEQIIVVDDGSTDDTAKVVNRFQHSCIQYIHQPHQGIASARNTGLEAARGEFIAFLDADDRWRPIYLEMMHAFLSEDPTAAVVFGNFVRFQHETGQRLGDQFHLYPEIKRPTLLKDEPYARGRIPQERAFRVLVGCADIPAYTQVMLFRRALIEQLRFEPSLVLGEDTHFALRAFLSGSVIFTDVVLAEVRRHDANATRNLNELAVHKLNALKALAPYVTRESDRQAFLDRLVLAHIDAALYRVRTGQVRAGLRTYRDIFSIRGSSLRKLKGFMLMSLALPRGLATRSSVAGSE